MQENTDNLESKADIAIVGMGPGGMAAAIQAASQGLSVVMFSDRGDYVRPQRLILDYNNIKLLKSFNMTKTPEDEDFLRSLDSEIGSPQAKDVERYLRRQVQYFQDQPDSKITVVNLAKQHTAIQSISPEKQGDCVTLKNGSVYYFRYLIGADGAKHFTSDRVKEGFNLDIRYEPSVLQDRHKEHGTVSLKINKNKGQVHENLDTHTVEDMKRQITEGRKQLKWDKPYEPMGLILFNEDRSKVTFSGEIPQSIFMAPPEMRRELLRQWAILAINCNMADEASMSITPEALEYRVSPNPIKNELMATKFEVPLVQSNRALYKLSHGVYAPIGDARRTPNYKLGHGLNHALKCGVEYVRCIGYDRSFDQNSYQEFVDSLDADIEQKMVFLQSLSNDSASEASDGGDSTDSEQSCYTPKS